MREPTCIPQYQTSQNLAQFLGDVSDLLLGDLRAHVREKSGLGPWLARRLPEPLATAVTSAVRPVSVVLTPADCETLASTLGDAPPSFLLRYESGFPAYIDYRRAIPELLAAGVPVATVERFAAEGEAFRRGLLQRPRYPDAARLVGEYVQSLQPLQKLAHDSFVVLARRAAGEILDPATLPRAAPIPLAHLRPARVAAMHANGEPGKMLDSKDVAKTCGVTIRTVARRRKEGLMPPPVKLGGSQVRWKPDVIEAWLRDGAAAPAEPKMTQSVASQ